MPTYWNPNLDPSRSSKHRAALKASDQAHVEVQLTTLRRAIADADHMLVEGIRARRRQFLLENAIREALALAAAGAELCVILATIREALS